MPRLLLLFFVAFLLSFPAPNRTPPNPESAANQEQPDFNLDGLWLSDQGEKVNVIQTTSGTVFATFMGSASCPNGGSRPKYIEGKLTGNILEGTMWRCTRDPDLVRKCGLDSVYQTRFKATVSSDSISGQWHFEWYARKDTEADCKWVRDSSRDGDNSFSLSRAQPTSSDSSDSTQNTPGDCPPGDETAGISQSAGFIFINPASGRAVSRQGPNESCPEVGRVPNGARLVYRRVVFNKDTGAPEWYEVEPPGGTPGWIPAGDTSNTRPVTPIPTGPTRIPRDSGGGTISASPTAGGRARPNTSGSNRRGTRRIRRKRTLNNP